jgi:hypothetical protein
MEFCEDLHLIGNLNTILMKSKHDTARRLGRFAVTVVAASLFIIFNGTHAFAQSPQTVRGVVTNAEDQEVVPGANIYLKGVSSVGTFSDAKGEFVFPRPLRSGDVLVFSFLGLKTTEYVVPEVAAGSVTIAMPIDPIQMVDEILVEGDDQPAFASKRTSKRKVNQDAQP